MTLRLCCAIGFILILPAPGAVRSQEPGADNARQAADNSYCFVCHNNYRQEELAVTHQQAGVGCEDCHGPSDSHSSDEDGLTAPEILYPLEKIDSDCLTCHPASAEAKAHAPLRSAESGPAQVCTDCHGKHRLAVRTRLWDKASRKLISRDGTPVMDRSAEPR